MSSIAQLSPKNDPLTRPLKTSETVARDIVRDIVTQGLRQGDRLPPESAMLEQYRVSRESLREGLRLLEVQGLITIRRGPGGGPMVGAVNPANLGRVSSLYYELAGGTYAELFEAWVLLEPILAEKAARHDDRDEARKAMAPFTGEGDGGADEELPQFVRSHAEFHAVVAQLSGNRVLELLLPTVGLILTHHIIGQFDPRDMQQELDRDHAAIAKAIAAGHATKARNLMEDHIGSIADYYQDLLGARADDFVDWR
jgi:GntR family transcriptional repressor for pyruvate dehydrogenase complex